MYMSVLLFILPCINLTNRLSGLPFFPTSALASVLCTCISMYFIQLKEFRQAVEDRHTHLYQNPYHPPPAVYPTPTHTDHARSVDIIVHGVLLFSQTDIFIQSVNAQKELSWCIEKR